MEWMPLPLCVPDGETSQAPRNEEANGRVTDGFAGRIQTMAANFATLACSPLQRTPRLPAAITESGILPIVCAAREAVPACLALLGQQPNTLLSVAIP